MHAADRRRLRAGVTLAIVISLAALVGDVLVYGALDYPAPLHAYGSFMALFVLYHAFRHLVAGVLIGALVLGRILRNRMSGRDYVMQATGWWFWWIAITAVLMLVLMATIQ